MKQSIDVQWLSAARLLKNGKNRVRYVRHTNSSFIFIPHRYCYFDATINIVYESFSLEGYGKPFFFQKEWFPAYSYMIYFLFAFFAAIEYNEITE